MAKSRRKNPIVCEAYVDNEHGHLVLIITDEGRPVTYRMFRCARKHRSAGGEFIAKGFRSHADRIMEMLERPEEEIVVARRNCDPKTRTKLTVGCSRKNPGQVLSAMRRDRDELLRRYGITPEEAEEMGRRRARRLSFIEWLHETETEAEHDARVRARREERMARRKGRKAGDEAVDARPDGEVAASEGDERKPSGRAARRAARKAAKARAARSGRASAEIARANAAFRKAGDIEAGDEEDKVVAASAEADEAIAEVDGPPVAMADDARASVDGAVGAVDAIGDAVGAVDAIGDAAGAVGAADSTGDAIGDAVDEEERVFDIGKPDIIVEVAEPPLVDDASLRFSVDDRALPRDRAFADWLVFRSLEIAEEMGTGRADVTPAWVAATSFAIWHTCVSRGVGRPFASTFALSTIGPIDELALLRYGGPGAHGRIAHPMAPARTCPLTPECRRVAEHVIRNAMAGGPSAVTDALLAHRRDWLRYFMEPIVAEMADEVADEATDEGADDMAVAANGAQAGETAGDEG